MANDNNIIQMLMILLVREALMVTKNSVTGQDASIIFNVSSMF